MTKPAQPATPLPWSDKCLGNNHDLIKNILLEDKEDVEIQISKQDLAHAIFVTNNYPRLLQEREKLIETVDTLITHAMKSHGSDTYYVEIKKAQDLLSEMKGTQDE